MEMERCCVVLSLSLFALCALVMVADVAYGDESKYWGRSPLPVFTRVEYKRYNRGNRTNILVRYKTNQRPHHQWYIDDIPFEGGVGDFFLLNTYDSYMTCFSNIIVHSGLGSRFSVCLSTPDAQSCLHLRPDILAGVSIDLQNEDVDFPWPLLVPAPLVRYNRGHKARIYAPRLDTYNYTYSGQFVYLDQDRADSSQTLLQAEASSAEDAGVDGRGVISIQPFQHRKPGWIVEVATDQREMEGVLLFRTTYLPPVSSMVERCVTTRPIEIYDRAHQQPFPENLVAMLPHSGDSLPVTCRTRERLFCLIVCPFAFNGDVLDLELALYRVRDGLEDEYLSLPSLGGQTRETGRYLGEARYTMTAENTEAGVYRCAVTLGGHTASTLVTLTTV